MKLMFVIQRLCLLVLIIGVLASVYQILMSIAIDWMSLHDDSYIIQRASTDEALHVNMIRHAVDTIDKTYHGDDNVEITDEYVDDDDKTYDTNDDSSENMENKPKPNIVASENDKETDDMPENIENEPKQNVLIGENDKETDDVSENMENKADLDVNGMSNVERVAMAEENHDNEIVMSTKQQQVKEEHHVAFLKVHKTGSSTVQNLFLRFVDSRNLTMVFGHSPGNPLAETKYPNMISFSNSLTKYNIVPPAPGRHYDILCCHVIFNETQFKRYMPHDTVYIGLVREPYNRLESSIRYFNSFADANLSDFAKDPIRYDGHLKSMSNNRMAFEFGFPLDLFPTKTQPVPDKSKVLSYLNNIKRQFDFILINERMEESLIYMRRLLGWKLEDIIFVKQLVSKKETRRLTAEDKANLATYLFLDIALYNLSVELFEAKFKSLGQDGIEEVEFFKRVLQQVSEFCILKPIEKIVIEESKWSDPITINHDKCKLYAIFEIKYVQDLRKKIYGTLNN